MVLLFYRVIVLLFYCFDQADKVRIMAVVDQYPGGVHGFNSQMRELADRLFMASRAVRSCTLAAWDVDRSCFCRHIDISQSLCPSPLLLQQTSVADIVGREFSSV